MCAQITNDDGTHVYWSYSLDPSTQQLYDYITDEALPTGPAIESPDETTGSAADADTATGSAVETDTSTGAAAGTDNATGSAADTGGDAASPGAAGGPDTSGEGEGAGD
jgi:hypothetical protein